MQNLNFDFAGREKGYEKYSLLLFSTIELGEW